MINTLSKEELKDLINKIAFTYNEMRSYEKSEITAMRNYDIQKSRMWLRQAETYRNAADKYKSMLDSNLLTMEIRKEAHNG